MAIVRFIVVVCAWLACTTAFAQAHPLGNFTSNHLTRIAVGSDAIDLHYVLDDAEIPTFSLLRSLDANGRPPAAALEAWAARHALEIAPQLRLAVDGTPATLRLVRTHAYLRPGAAGLTTLYFTADYRAARGATAQHIDYTDATLPGRIGWKDVVVLPQREPTDELRTYPSALIGSPRDVTSVGITVAPGGALQVAQHVLPLADGGVAEGRMNDLSDVLARNLADPLVLLGALLLAVGLGALHALEPGHGKTLLAISLVGARATVSQAAILAGALTVAHTAGVLIFGVVVLTLARYIVPEALYPWIALLSGAFVAVLGARALANDIVRRRRAHEHDAAHAHGEAHAHAHDHGEFDDVLHAHAHAVPGKAPLRFREALVAAASGNVAPCPAALVVLLAAIATQRVGYGLILIVAFSIGLALTLTGLGVAVVHGAAWLTQRPQFDRAARFAPLVTACAISVIGAWMIGEALVAQGLAATPVATAILVLAAIAAFTIVRTTQRALPRKAIA